MSWWVLNYHNYTRSWNQLFVLAATTADAHLFMAWSKHKPTRKAIWKVVRGKHVFCGYKYIWDTPIITQQTEPGDTPWHTWHLKKLESHDHIWYYLFSPHGPYGLECQGPLIHVPPPEVHLWSERMIVGTKLKGIFYSWSFSGPGGPPPIWKPYNAGLYSLKIWQLEPDPLGVEYRHYCIAGDPTDRVLYRRQPPVSPLWVPLLTAAQVGTISGLSTPTLRWVATNINHPSYLYLLVSGYVNSSTCARLLRSPDYGANWTLHHIHDGLVYDVGNLSTGILQGSSPYPPGNVIYATVNHEWGGRSYIHRSFDNATTFIQGGYTGVMLNACRCLVDPTDQSIVYMGGYGSGYFPRRLFRSASHGGVWVNISDTKTLGTFISVHPANAWIDPTNHEFLRVLQDGHIWTTPNSGITWEDWGATQYYSRRHSALWENPNRLYLARNVSASGPPPGPLNHVIYVSDTHGIYMEGKSGEHPYFTDGGGDSIPYNCGGVCLQGMMIFPPY